MKNVNPTSGEYTSAAVAIMYRGIGGTPVKVKTADVLNLAITVQKFFFRLR